MTSFDSGLFSISSSPPPYSLRVVNKWAERIKYSYLCANTSLPKPLTTVCRLIVQVQLTATKHCHKSLPSVTNTNSELVSLWASVDYLPKWALGHCYCQGRCSQLSCCCTACVGGTQMLTCRRMCADAFVCAITDYLISALHILEQWYFSDNGRR